MLFARPCLSVSYFSCLFVSPFSGFFGYSGLCPSFRPPPILVCPRAVGPLSPGRSGFAGAVALGCRLPRAACPCPPPTPPFRVRLAPLLFYPYFELAPRSRFGWVSAGSCELVCMAGFGGRALWRGLASVGMVHALCAWSVGWMVGRVSPRVPGSVSCPWRQ